ncbi:MAG: PQQ-binding-like beta-propeller repeat protein [Thermoguttaceae bacterium]|nr:PQQ-binding-like beta-propeller repeat protein [Thermoguttaceae bacterium]MDW8079004.1 PQQ-binding-like beta-propeller repeat protein [Thermoguttaceae bacterium]
MSTAREPSAREFLELLRRRDLLPPDILARWEQEIARAKKPLTARWLADRLIELDYLTNILADKLLRELSQRPSAEEYPVAPSTAAPASREALPLESDELELAPIDELPTPSRRSGPVPAVTPPAAPSRPPVTERPPSPPPAKPAMPRRPAVDQSDLWAEIEAPAPAPVEEALGPEEPAVIFRRRRRNVWESPLFLIGGGALILLVITMLFLLWAVRRQSADQLFALAEEDYRSGSYTQAIAKFTEFLDKFPQHPRAGIARVHRGLALMRQAVEGSTDWVATLSVTKQVLEEISAEETFKEEARGELIALLPRIAQELAKRALQKLDPDLVEKSQEALGLVSQYVAPSDRPAALISDIEAMLAIAQHRLTAGDRLRQTLEEIDQAIANRDCTSAHQLRRQLLRDYPQLAQDPSVEEAGRRIVALERELVSVLPAEGKVSASDWPAAAEHLLLACRSETKSASVPAGQVVCALCQGVAFGLDAQSGKVLWRRVVGEHLTANRLPAVPIPLEEAGRSDFLLVDVLHQALLRLDGATGQLRWRAELDEAPAAQPTVALGGIWLVFQSGKLVEIDPSTGQVVRGIHFPQALRVPPALDDQGRFLFQPGEHSTLFVLRRSDGSCIQTVYIGHDPGAVLFPAVTLGSYVLLPVNSGVKQTDIHIFHIKGDQAEPLQPVRTLRLPARLALPPLVSGNRIFVASQEGPAWVYELAAAQSDDPLQEIVRGDLGSAEREVGPAEKIVFSRFGLFETAQVWIADYQLTCYDVLPLKGALQPKAIRNEASVAIQPLVAMGQSLFHFRKVWGLPDLVVSAFRVDDAQLLWETRLSVPLAAEPFIDTPRNMCICVTKSGSLFRLPIDKLPDLSIVDEPYVTLKLAELKRPVQSAVATPEGIVVIVLPEGSERLPVYDPAEPVARFRWVLLPSPLGGPVASFRQGIVLATQAGQLLWIYPRDGKLLAEPFPFPLPAGVAHQWTAPQPVGEDELVVGEQSGKLYRLKLVSEPKPHFRLVAERGWKNRLAGPLTFARNTLWTVDGEGTLVGFSLPELEIKAELKLGETAAWGPFAVGQLILIATGSELLCVNEAGQVTWRLKTERGIPVGQPWADQASAILSTRDGWLVQIALASGEIVNAKRLDAPLATGPIPLGDRWIVGGSDGCLYRAQLP